MKLLPAIAFSFSILSYFTDNAGNAPTIAVANPLPASEFEKVILQYRTLYSIDFEGAVETVEMNKGTLLVCRPSESYTRCYFTAGPIDNNPATLQLTAPSALLDAKILRGAATNTCFFYRSPANIFADTGTKPTDYTSSTFREDKDITPEGQWRHDVEVLYCYNPRRYRNNYVVFLISFDRDLDKPQGLILEKMAMGISGTDLRARFPYSSGTDGSFSVRSIALVDATHDDTECTLMTLPWATAEEPSWYAQSRSVDPDTITFGLNQPMLYHATGIRGISCKSEKSYAADRNLDWGNIV